MLGLTLHRLIAPELDPLIELTGPNKDKLQFRQMSDSQQFDFETKRQEKADQKSVYRSEPKDSDTASAAVDNNQAKSADVG